MSHFSIHRVWYLLRHMFVSQRRTAVISFAAIFGAFTIVVLFSFIEGIVPEIHNVPAALYFGIVGLVIAGTAFGELHDGKRSYGYLLLPASAAEKVTAAILATGVLWIPFAFLSYWLFSVLMAGLSLLILGEALPFYQIFTAENGELVLDFVTAHALFLFGAVYFRGKNLLKTVATLAGVGFGISALVGLAGWLLFKGFGPDLEQLFQGTVVSGDISARVTRIADMFVTAQNVGVFLAQYILPPALWVLTWQRLRETEVAHGV